MEIPAGNIITAIATVISVVVANRISSSQTGRAKLWDLRRHAYSVIVSELASVERICDVGDYCLQENAYEYFQSDIRNTHNERMNLHMKTARQKFSDEYLILSKEFIDLFQEFTTDLEAGRDEVFPADHESFTAAIRKHRPLLLAQGRDEIDLSTNTFLQNVFGHMFRKT